MKTASISTGTPSGSEATPIALRAPTPASGPKTSTISSLKPLTTAGCAVKSARQHGYKTLICSNNFPARINGLQKRFGFLDDFDVVVLSYKVGACKPFEPIFQELVRQAGVPAESIVFADDDEKALGGAKQAGITAFLYENFEGFTADLKKLGVEL